MREEWWVKRLEKHKAKQWARLIGEAGSSEAAGRERANSQTASGHLAHHEVNLAGGALFVSSEIERQSLSECCSSHPASPKASHRTSCKALHKAFSEKLRWRGNRWTK